MTIKLAETIDLLIEKYEELDNIEVCTIDSSTHDVKPAHNVYVIKDGNKHFILLSPIDLIGKGIFLDKTQKGE